MAATPHGWKTVPDKSEQFPDEGKIFSIERVLLGARTDCHWIFETEVNDRYVEGKKGDRTRAVRPIRARDLIDLSGVDLERARVMVVEEGLKLSFKPHDPMILLKGNRCISLNLEERSGRWTPPLGLSLNKLEYSMLQDADVAGDRLAGRLFVLPGHELGAVAGSVDWSSDAAFLQDLFKVVRKQIAAGAFSDEGLLTKGAVEVIARFARNADLLPKDRQEISGFAERLRSFQKDLSGYFNDLDEIVALLHAINPVEARIASDIESMRQTMLNGMRSELEAKIRADYELENQSLIAESRTLASEVSELSKAALDAKRALDDSREERDRTKALTANHLDRLRASLESYSTFDHRSVRRFVEHLALDFGGDPSVLFPSDVPPWGVGKPRIGRKIALAELRSRLMSTAEANVLLLDTLVEMDALLRAGELAVVAGRHSNSYVEAYGLAVAGGQIRRLSVDPTILGVDDLWRIPGTGAPTSFALGWTAALANPDLLVLVALDNLQSGPFDAWISHLQTLLRSNLRPRNLLVVGSLSGPAIDQKRSTAAALAGIFTLEAKVARGDRTHALQLALKKEHDSDATQLIQIVPHDLSGETMSKLATACARNEVEAEEIDMVARLARSASSTLEDPAAFALRQNEMLRKRLSDPAEPGSAFLTSILNGSY